MAEGAVFTGATRLDTSGMRAGFARMRTMTRRAAAEMSSTFAARRGGTSAPLSGWDRSINSTRNSLARVQSTFANLTKMTQYYGTRLKKDVLVPLTQATQAATRLAKRAAIAGAALASFGVYRNFKIEGMTEQFAVLMKNSKQARRMMRDLLNQAAVSPFGLEDYVGSVRMLYTIGGQELSNKSFIRMMGDAAAVTGKDMQQVAAWTAKLYQSLKSGAGVGTSGDDMLRAGLLTAETYAYMKSHGKTVGNFNEVWARGVKDLSRFAGGMNRIRYTGQGAFNMLKGLSALGIQDLFKGFTKSVKNVVYNINNLLKSMRQTGQFKAWGKEIGQTAADAVNGIYRLIQSYRALDDESRASVNNVLAVMGTLAGMQYTGILAPLVKAATGAASIIMSIVTRTVLFTLSNLAVVSGAFAGLGTALIGLNLGNALYKSLGDTGKKITELVATIIEGIVKFLWNAVKTAFVPIGKAIWEAISNPRDFSFEKFGKTLKDNFSKEARNWMLGIGNSIEQAIAVWQVDSEPAKAFGDAWMELPEKIGGAVGEAIGKIKNLNLDDLLKIPGMEGIAKWVSEFKKLEKIKLPQMPKPPDLNGQVRQANQIAQTLGKLRAYTSRGWYFQWIDMATVLKAAKNTGKLANHNPAAEQRKSSRNMTAIEKNTTRTNKLLEEIRKNTAKKQPAVYA